MTKFAQSLILHYLVIAALAACFPNAPAANGKESASLKTFNTDRKGHDRRYAIDETKARKELDYRANRTFDEGFAKTLDWYLNNEDWWKALMAVKN